MRARMCRLLECRSGFVEMVPDQVTHSHPGLDRERPPETGTVEIQLASRSRSPRVRWLRLRLARTVRDKFKSRLR